MVASSFIFVVILVSLATHRLTRLSTRDKFPLICVPRDKFVERWGVYADAEPHERGKSISGKKTNLFMRSLAYAVECDWCTSMWVGAGVTYGTWYFLPAQMGAPTVLWVLLWLSSSSLTGLIAQRESD
jgi:hypothetical protein